MLDFEWDEEKRRANIRKHGMDFVLAAKVFADFLGIDEEERSMDYGEMRRKLIGFAAGELIAVIYIPRGESIRIISARKATRSERRLYEEAP